MVKGNTFAATAFFSYGSFWCGWFLMKYLAATAPVAGAGMAKSDNVGATLFDVIWGVFTLVRIGRGVGEGTMKDVSKLYPQTPTAVNTIRFPFALMRMP
jgi:succinate-acetate transporter protein